jgi:hypothetical protein
MTAALGISDLLLNGSVKMTRLELVPIAGRYRFP